MTNEFGQNSGEADKHGKRSSCFDGQPVAKHKRGYDDLAARHPEHAADRTNDHAAD